MPRMQRFMSKSLAKKLSPTFIWSEIMSVIKGSLRKDGRVHQKFLSRREYSQLGSHWLDRKELNTLYYIFLQYEEWKTNVRAFDFLDVVSHVLSHVCGADGNWQWGYGGYKVTNSADFLIIDEVQDLYPKTIQLLLSVSRYRVVFAGDTAQTIAKGVSSRIQDTRHLLSRNGLCDTEAVNLSINYRSQNSILQLANNVVKLIETIFPDSIDKLNEEVSEKTGDKPCLIEPCGQDLLCEFFFGKTVSETAAAAGSAELAAIEEEDAGAEAARPEGERRNMTPQFGAS